MGDFTQAGPVTVRRVDTGEVVETRPAYTDGTHEAIVAEGNRKGDPSLRARKRRSHT